MRRADSPDRKWPAKLLERHIQRYFTNRRKSFDQQRAHDTRNHTLALDKSYLKAGKLTQMTVEMLSIQLLAKSRTSPTQMSHQWVAKCLFNVNLFKSSYKQSIDARRKNSRLTHYNHHTATSISSRHAAQFGNYPWIWRPTQKRYCRSCALV